MSLQCPQCGFNNPPGMRFCGNCGTRLEEAEIKFPVQTVPEIPNTSEPIGVMIGADLIERFKQAGLEAAGQRRNVTVLFVDICDYTVLAEEMDSEDLFDLVQKVIRMLVEKVYEYEGTVDKILGDGLMALFGAPIAHENDAERAVRAAMDMQAEIANYNQYLKEGVNFGLQLHVGLNSGTVVVGSVGSNMLMDYTAIGDTVNLANRLEEVAEAGMVLVSESVFRSCKALFDFHLIPSLILKGISKEVPGYRLLGIKSRQGSVRGLEGLRAPLVGRDVELQCLKNVVQSLLNQREGQFVLITGEAGIGKSRLTSELKAQIEHTPVRIIEGQSLTYRRSVSYWIFLGLLRNYIDVTDQTPPNVVRERLVTKVYDALGGQAAEVLPYLEHLFSLEHFDVKAAERLSYLDASQLRQRIFIAVRDLLLAEARQRPLMLILEDLHWADDTSLELLLFLIDAIKQAPLLVYAITRPFQGGILGEIASHAQAGLKERFIPIHLKSLSQDQSERLLFELLAIPNLPDELRTDVLQRSAGIPFYLEEILRMLIEEQVIKHEDGQWQLAPGKDFIGMGVPDNLRGLILTRFDRLGPEHRKVLQAAAVIGKQFNLHLLAEILHTIKADHLQQLLADLVGRGFILHPSGISTSDFSFRHVLTSDAIYSTLLKRHRRELHGSAAEAIENIYADHLESQIEVLADHYLRSTKLDRALLYLILAGQKAARDYANEQARRHYETALSLFSQASPSASQSYQVHQGLGDVLVFVGEYQSAREHFQIALAVIGNSDSDRFVTERSILQRKIGTTFERQGDFERALVHLTDAWASIENIQPSPQVEKAEVLNEMGWIQFLRGNFDKAGKNLMDALELVETCRKYDVIASIHNRLGAVAYHQRKYDKASAHVRKSLALRETIGDMSGVARLYNNLGLLGLIRGDLRDSETNFTRSIEILERIGDAEGIALSFTNLGLVQYDRGDFDSAEANLNKSLAVTEQIGHRFYRGRALMYLGRLRTAQGNFGQAEKLLSESIQILEELGAQDDLVDAGYYAAENCFAQVDLDCALSWINESLEMMKDIDKEGLGASVQRGRLLRLRGAIARVQGEYQSAEELLNESANIFSASYERLEAAKTVLELGNLAYCQDNILEARQHFQEARLLFYQFGAEKYLKLAEKTLEQLV